MLEFTTLDWGSVPVVAALDAKEEVYIRPWADALPAEITKLIYIGEYFYRASGSWMSPIYTEAGQRYDWGFVQRDLDRGGLVIIRPATPEEQKFYDHKLTFLLLKKE